MNEEELMKEPTLGSPQNTIAVLQKYNFAFQKKFGQNFLIDTHVLDKICLLYTSPLSIQLHAGKYH